MPTFSGQESWGPGQTGRGRKRNIPPSGLGDWNEQSGEKQENENVPRTLSGGISSEWGGGLVMLWRILAVCFVFGTLEGAHLKGCAALAFGGSSWSTI